MRFTDIFVRRPVLAIVVNLVDPDRRPPVDPGAERQAVSPQRYRRREGVDNLRRRERRPRARVHHHAARTGDRERRRHRLRRIVERAVAQHDHRPPAAELRHQRGADADPGQGRTGPKRSAAGGRGAGDRAGNGRQPVRRDVSQLRVGGSGSEPDHGLPHPRRAAEAQRRERRAARRYPRRSHVRHAYLARSGQDGRARNLRVGTARGAGAQQLPVRARPDEGVDGIGEPGRQHRSPDTRRVPSARGQARERRRGPPRRDRRRRPGRGELRRGRSLQRSDRGVHGTLGAADRELARGNQARTRGAARDPGAAAGRHVGRGALRCHRLHPGRARRGAHHAHRDADHRRGRHLSIPGFAASSVDPGGRDSDLTGRRRVPDARRRLHHQPADPARDRPRRRPGRRRRDRDGGEHRAAPA